MMRITLRAAWLLTVWALTLPVHAAEAEAMLERMQRAARSLDYDGTFIYQHGNQLESFRIVHRGTGTSGARERLISLNGTPREIIRNDREVRCYLPDEKTVLVEPRRPGDQSFPSLLPGSFAALNAHYKFRSGQEERVAGRKSRVVAIWPRDAYRFGYRLWTDEDSGLLLKAQLIDDRGKTIEQYLFTQISIGKPIVDADLRPQGSNHSLANKISETTTSTSATRWGVLRLPPGFLLTAHTARHPPAQREPAEQLVYSDGLAVVSVFVELAGVSGSPAALAGPTQIGAVHAFGKVVNGHQITVVGAVPAVTVNLMGESVSEQR